MSTTIVGDQNSIFDTGGARALAPDLPYEDELLAHALRLQAAMLRDGGLRDVAGDLRDRADAIESGAGIMIRRASHGAEEG